MYVFSIELGWLPSVWSGKTVMCWAGLFTLGWFKAPAAAADCAFSIMLPLFIRLRSEMEALSAEYVKFAWAKA